MKQPGATIYLVTNLVNGKQYVGVTRFSVSSRWTQHLYKAKTGIKTYLYSAMRKYGSDKFTVEAVASCLSSTDVSELERSIIQSLAPAYNQTNGGEITVGKRVPREVVERIIAKNTGLKRTPEQNLVMSELKKKQYAERPALKAMVTAHIKSVRGSVNEEKRIAAARSINAGKKRTNQERSHLRAIRKQAWNDPEYRKRMHEVLIRPKSLKARQKMSISAKNRALDMSALGAPGRCKRWQIERDKPCICGTHASI